MPVMYFSVSPSLLLLLLLLSSPKNGWNECPSGMLARGKYSAVATFTDSDKVDHSQFKYTLKITK